MNEVLIGILIFLLLGCFVAPFSPGGFPTLMVIIGDVLWDLIILVSIILTFYLIGYMFLLFI